MAHAHTRLHDVLSAGIVRRDSQPVPTACDTPFQFTRSQVQKSLLAQAANVALYMPSLADMQAAVVATHKIYVYAEKNADLSDAWASHWNADDANYAPSNHFDAINFLTSNEYLINRSIELVLPMENRIQSKTLDADEIDFVKNFLLARTMIIKLDKLNTYAPEWRQMQIYGPYYVPA